MKLIVDENSEEQRLDLYLSELMADYSRSKIQSAIKDGYITINNKKVKPSQILKIGDLVEFSDLVINKWQCAVEANPQPEDISLDIIWEDDNMLVINKPSGMLTHPTVKEMSATLVNALLFKYGENLSDLNGRLRRGIVHRLDRNTSGLIMVAKNNKTHEFLVQEMKDHNFTKKYLAVVRGVVESDEFELDYPIGRHLKQPHKQCVRDDGKPSKTIVKVLQRFCDATLVELTLITGRTHQIRVHMSHIGHPVFNDTLYGFGKIRIKTEEQVLQSYRLEFTQPFTKNRITLEIPKDEKIIKVLKAIS